MKKNLLFILLFLLSVTTNSYADKWQTVGARAMGMGGAGVAIAYGADAQYYNPALLATSSELGSDISLNINAEIETTDKVLTLIDKVNGMIDKYEIIIKKIINKDYANAKDMISIVDTLVALQELNLKNIGATINANTGLSAKLGKLAVSVRSYGSLGITPIVDKKNIGLVSSVDGIKIDNFNAPDTQDKRNAANTIKNTLDKYDLTDSVANLFKLSGKNSEEIANAIVNMTDSAHSTVEEIKEMADKIATDFPNAEKLLKALISGSYKDNESQVLVDAGIFTEISFGYGLEIIKGLQVGGNIKYIQGQMGQAGIMLLKDDESVEDVAEQTFKKTKASNQIGIDLGAFLDISKLIDNDIILNPKFGITARNINNPYFERPEKPSNSKLKWIDGKYYLGSQLRAGLAINPIEKLTVACDLDLLKNKTFVNDFESQELSAGIEYLLLNKKSFSLPLRTGISKNVAASKSNIEYTVGTGIYTFGFCFELAAGMSSNTATFDGKKIPASASVALNLGYTF
ncbi:MAG: conjugal transfer protein TraF [Elusimicrobia bacterium]|nr:conjugal transfer protein TraF [Elusimicrobiota bacterium]